MLLLFDKQQQVMETQAVSFPQKSLNYDIYILLKL